MLCAWDDVLYWTEIRGARLPAEIFPPELASAPVERNGTKACRTKNRPGKPSADALQGFFREYLSRLALPLHALSDIARQKDTNKNVFTVRKTARAGYWKSHWKSAGCRYLAQ